MKLVYWDEVTYQLSKVVGSAPHNALFVWYTLMEYNWMWDQKGPALEDTFSL